MGFFKSIFSDRKEYPELDAASPVARQLEPLRPFLEGLTREIKDSMEVVPCPHGAFVFIGKPPKKFGAVWIKDGRVTNLKDIAARKSGDEMMALVERLRAAYRHGSEAPGSRPSWAARKWWWRRRTGWAKKWSRSSNST